MTCFTTEKDETPSLYSRSLRFLSILLLGFLFAYVQADDYPLLSKPLAGLKTSVADVMTSSGE